MRSKGYAKVLLLFSLMGICVGCDSAHENSVRFIFPDNFRGPFLLIHSDTGIALANEGKECIIHVPSSGELIVSDDSPLREWRQREASFVNGQKLPTFDVRDNELALRGGGYGQRNDEPPRTTFFVGTQQEFEAYLKQ